MSIFNKSPKIKVKFKVFVQDIELPFIVLYEVNEWDYDNTDLSWMAARLYKKFVYKNASGENVYVPSHRIEKITWV